MELPEHFERFHRKISIDENSRNRVLKAHTALRRNLERDKQVSPALYETFLQGSYVHGTLLRPLDRGQEFDVDVCCSIDLDAVPAQVREPRHLVRWVATRLKKVEAYKGRVSTRPRCVRVDFPGDFHMDVVPLAGDSRNQWTNLHVPNRTVNGWEQTNPKRLADWYHQQNRNTNGRFVRVAKMLKHWRNQSVPKAARPPSVGLEVLLARHWPHGADSDGAAVAGVFRGLDQALRFLYGVPNAMNPSLLSENLLRDWDQSLFEVFKEQIAEAAQLATEAVSERNDSRSVGLWQRLFVKRFPGQQSRPTTR